MAVLFQDTFNRVGSTLGADWTEQVGGSAPALNTDMATDGSQAVINISGRVHCATANATLQTDQFVQCWCMCRPGDNAGVVFRFQDPDNFYFLFFDPSGGDSIRLWKRVAGAQTELASPASPVALENVWHRLSVQMQGSVIFVWLDNRYIVAGAGATEGPVIGRTDTSIVGPGRCGIFSGGNDSTLGNGPLWNDFIAFDGAPQTIYVDTAFNGGVVGEGMGTAERPDFNIDWALHNAGTVRRGTVKVTSTTALDNNDYTEQFPIGHEQKFTGAYTFPVYTPDNGRVTSPGSPNLIIESADNQRLTLRDVSNKQFFQMRGEATGVVFRGFDFDGPFGASTSITVNVDAPNDHAVHFAKCTFTLSNMVGNSNAMQYHTNDGMLLVEMQYCYFTAGQGTHTYFVDINDRIRRLIAEFCIFRGKISSPTGQLAAGINAGTSTDLLVGDTWRINHCDFLDIFRTLFNDGAFSVLDAPGFQGTVDFKNNIIRGDPGNLTTFGVYTGGNTMGAGGLISCHHNGYHNVTTERDVGATNSGNEIGGDPEFNAPGSPFLWQHTAGGGGNGEGTFLPFTLPGDFRPTTPTYVDSADDSSPLLGVLDRGALQGFATVSTPPGSEVEIEDRYCVSVIYDPGGPNETDLSSRFETARPLRQEKDVLLRQYKASDTDLEFSDVDGIFLELNSFSFLLDATGRPNWYGKPCDVYVTRGAEQIVRYRAFVTGADAERGVGRLRLANRFQQIFERQAFANSMGRVVSTSGAPGMGQTSLGSLGAPASGAWLTRVILNHQSPFNEDFAARVETLTVTFLTAGAAASFSIVGSVTGAKGFGNVATLFTSNDFQTDPNNPVAIGSFTISPAFWVNTAAITQANMTCTLKLVWRPSPGLRIIDSLIQFLTDDHTCRLTTANLDTASFDSFRNTIADHPVALVSPHTQQLSRLVVDEPSPLLTYLLEFAMHAGAALIERADGRFALNSIVPRSVELGELPVLCKTVDLMALAVSHLEIYNSFSFEYNRLEGIDKYVSGGKWPVAFNDSFDRYQRVIDAPGPQRFRAFDEGARAWIEAIAQSSFLRYKDPRRIYGSKAKIDRMDADLDTTYRVDSEGPTFRGPVVEPFAINRNVSGDLTVDLDLLEIQVLTEECGDFLWYDNEIMGYDDECWGYF